MSSQLAADYGRRHGGVVTELDAFLKLDDVKRATGLGRSKIYALMADGKFPKPVNPTGGRGVAWIGSEIAQWQRQRIAERDAA